jgi:hypothetical protein
VVNTSARVAFPLDEAPALVAREIDAMSTLINPPVPARKTPPDAFEPNRPAPHWQVVLAAPIAEVLEAMRAANCDIRLTAGCLDASGPLSAAQALRALRRRGREVERHLQSEAVTEGA